MSFNGIAQFLGNLSPQPDNISKPQYDVDRNANSVNVRWENSRYRLWVQMYEDGFVDWTFRDRFIENSHFGEFKTDPNNPQFDSDLFKMVGLFHQSRG